jgi:hypothetical protein
VYITPTRVCTVIAEAADGDFDDDLPNYAEPVCLSKGNYPQLLRRAHFFLCAATKMLRLCVLRRPRL